MMLTWREVPRSWLLSMFGFVIGYGAHAIWAVGEAISEWGTESCPDDTSSTEILQTRVFLGLSAFVLSATLVLTFLVGNYLSRPGKLITALTACLDVVISGMLFWGLYVYVTAACKLPVLFVTVAFWAGHLFLSIAVASGWAALLRRITRRRKRRERRRRERGTRTGPGPLSGSLVRKVPVVSPRVPPGHRPGKPSGSTSAFFSVHHPPRQQQQHGPAGSGVGQPSLNNWVQNGLASPGTGRSRSGALPPPVSSPPLRFMHPHLAFLHREHGPPSASSAAPTPPAFAIMSGTESARRGGGGGGGTSVPGRTHYLAPPSPNVYSPR